MENLLIQKEKLLEKNKGTLTLDTELADLNGWDSLAVVEFIALADDEYKVDLDFDRMESCVTIADLFDLLK